MSKYIDGDVLFNEVTNSYRCATGEARIAYRNVLDMICNANNKDVEEVRHGKWIDTTEYCGEFTCSICKEMCINNTYKYCPHCGAKMKKEKKNKIRCGECKYLEISGCYGECGKAYRGIVNPDDSCGKGKRKDKKEKEK